ncbi:hypothetical protein Taro_029811 [Colocasia esculenta]|uniref:Uncharacterized protein n=1 Tax=Colocasia esculenta TaxID=4460 RepID=A0A843VUB8_COLES|nr:hypothetical protein [Colocasia esculenta]
MPAGSGVRAAGLELPCAAADAAARAEAPSGEDDPGGVFEGSRGRLRLEVFQRRLHPEGFRRPTEFRFGVEFVNLCSCCSRE